MAETLENQESQPYKLFVLRAGAVGFEPTTFGFGDQRSTFVFN